MLIFMIWLLLNANSLAVVQLHCWSAWYRHGL